MLYSFPYDTLASSVIKLCDEEKYEHNVTLRAINNKHNQPECTYAWHSTHADIYNNVIQYGYGDRQAHGTHTTRMSQCCMRGSDSMVLEVLAVWQLG